MTEWVLVMYIYAGIMAKGDSVSMISISGFTTEQTCKDAGKYGNPLVSNTTKDYRYICLPRK